MFSLYHVVNVLFKKDSGNTAREITETSEQRTLWDQYNFLLSSLRGSNCIKLIVGIKFGDLVLSKRFHCI